MAPDRSALLRALVLACTILWSDRFEIDVPGYFTGTIYQEVAVQICPSEYSVEVAVKTRLLEEIAGVEREVSGWETRVSDFVLPGAPTSDQ